MASDESDIEMKSALPVKSTKKPPPSPSEDILKKQDKKISTKEMVVKALFDLHTRKGVSLYAIKKYLESNYNIDTEKNNYIIKKSIKGLVESGGIVQTKGIGAAGSFKLAVKKPPKKVKPKKEPKEKPAKEKKEKSKEPSEVKKVKKTMKGKELKKKSSKTEKKPSEKLEKKPSKKVKLVEKESKKSKPVKDKVSKVKVTKGVKTPAKKKGSLMKRKSIGSIIKPPQMKPKKA